MEFVADSEKVTRGQAILFPPFKYLDLDKMLDVVELVKPGETSLKLGNKFEISSAIEVIKKPEKISLFGNLF